MVFLKRNMFAFLNYIYFRLYMPQLFWEQGRISIDSELYHEKNSEIQEIQLHLHHVFYFSYFIKLKHVFTLLHHPSPDIKSSLKC